MPVIREDGFDAGRLQHRVRIQEKTVSGIDTYGHEVYTWTDRQVCYANVMALQGREFEAARQVWTDARYQVTTRYLTGITTEMRVHWDETGQNLDILDAQYPWGNRQTMVMTCKEVQ